MAGRNLRVVFAEINDAIAGIEQAIEGRGVEDFGHDWLLKHGVERGLEIISEAARHIPDRYTAHEPDIPWKQIRGIGNILRHEYHKIADGIVWAVAIDYLPPLRQQLRGWKRQSVLKNRELRTFRRIVHESGRLYFQPVHRRQPARQFPGAG